MKIEGLKFKLCFLLLAFSWTHNASFALSLGRIMTNSMYGEPLDADIALENTSMDLKASQLKVRLSDDIQFRQVGLKKQPYHNQLTFKPYSDSANNWFIKVKSSEPISTQFLSFLLTVEWPRGRATREYITIMKAPTFEKKTETSNTVITTNNVALATTEGAKQIVRPEQNPSQDNDLYKDYQDNSSLSGILGSAYASLSKVMPTGDVSENLTEVTSDPNTFTNTPVNASNQPVNVVTYKPQSSTSTVTVPGDTLSEIAEGATQADTVPGITRQQMMIAIYASNKHAFVNGDMQRLKGNTVINIPSLEQAKEIYAKEQNNFQIQGTTIVQVKQPAVDISTSTVAVNTTPTATTLNSAKAPIVIKVKSTAPTKVVKRKTTTKTAAATPARTVVAKQTKTIIPSKQITPASAQPRGGFTPAVPDIIRISPVDGNIASLKVTDAKKAETQIAQNPLFTPSDQSQTTTTTTASRSNTQNTKTTNDAEANNETTFDAKGALAQFNSIQADIDKAKTDSTNITATTNTPRRLEIVSADSSVSSGERYLADAERLVTRQREIQELKEQLAMLKAQLDDMARLVALRTSGSVNKDNITVASTSASDQAANTQTVTRTLAMPVNTSTETTQTVASDSYVGSLVDSVSSSLEEVNNNTEGLTNDKLEVIFYTIMALIAAGALAGFAYQYSRREKREARPANIPNFIDDEVIADYNVVAAEEEFIEDYYPIHEEEREEEEYTYAQASGIKEDQMESYYRLVQAYLDLNDHVNAKKILDIIHNKGTPEQREYADRIYQQGAAG